MSQAQLVQTCTFLARDGCQMAYRLYGRIEPTRPAIIFVHGFEVESGVYDSLCAGIARQTQLPVYAFRLRGQCAATPGTVDLDCTDRLCADMGDFAALVARSTGELKPYVVAHSGGCSFVLRWLNSTCAAAVQGLLFIAPVFMRNIELHRQPPPIYQLVHRIWHYRRPVQHPQARGSLNQEFRFSTSKSLLAALPVLQWLRVLSVRANESQGWRHYTQRYIGAYQTLDLYGDLRRLSSKLWLILGAEDEFCLPGSIKNAFSWNVQPAFLTDVVTVGSAGHFSILPFSMLQVARWIKANEAAGQGGVRG